MCYNRGVVLGYGCGSMAFKFVPLSYMGSEVKECGLFMVAEKKLCAAFFS